MCVRVLLASCDSLQRHRETQRSLDAAMGVDGPPIRYWRSRFETTMWKQSVGDDEFQRAGLHEHKQAKVPASASVVSISL